MTYCNDENDRYAEAECLYYEWLAECDLWDAQEPGWEELSTDPEQRNTVSESDVFDAHNPVLVSTGNQWTLIPSADDPDGNPTVIR